MKLPTNIDTNVKFKFNLGKSFKVFIVPISLSILLFLGTLIGINTFNNQIKSLGKELETVQRDENILEEKLDLLRTVQADILSRADTTLISLPDYNPTLIVLSQLGNLAIDNSIRITERRASILPDLETGIFNGRLTIKTRGELLDTLNFIMEMENKNPVTSLKSAKINTSREGINSEIDFTIYWATLPDKLPAITQPLKRLSTSDQELIFRLSAKDSPTFNILEKSGPYDRQDPFTFLDQTFEVSGDELQEDEVSEEAGSEESGE